MGDSIAHIICTYTINIITNNDIIEIIGVNSPSYNPFFNLLKLNIIIIIINNNVVEIVGFRLPTYYQFFNLLKLNIFNTIIKNGIDGTVCNSVGIYVGSVVALIVFNVLMLTLLYTNG